MTGLVPHPLSRGYGTLLVISGKASFGHACSTAISARCKGSWAASSEWLSARLQPGLGTFSSSSSRTTSAPVGTNARHGALGVGGHRQLWEPPRRRAHAGVARDEFRRNARKGHAEAFVVSGNADGSLKLTESRVLEASGLAATIIRVSLSWTVGFMGLVSTLKGAKATAHEAHKRGPHVGSDESTATRSLPRPDRARPFCWFAARTERRGTSSRRERRTVRATAGTARRQTS